MRNFLERVYSYVRRFFLQRNTLFLSPEMSRQQGYGPDQRYAQYEGAFPGPDYQQPGNISPQQEYERQYYQRQGGMYSQPSYSQPGGMYPGQGYSQSGYTRRGGVNPWIAGGLGALGGGLAGYGLGQAVGEVQEYANDHPLANGDYDIGNAVESAGFGSGNEGFSEAGFGEGDFGGE